MITIVDIYIDDPKDQSDNCDTELGYIIITQDDAGRFDFLRGTTCACRKGCHYRDCLIDLHPGQRFENRKELWTMVGAV